MESCTLTIMQYQVSYLFCLFSLYMAALLNSLRIQRHNKQRTASINIQLDLSDLMQFLIDI